MAKFCAVAFSVVGAVGPVGPDPPDVAAGLDVLPDVAFPVPPVLVALDLLSAPPADPLVD